jgi:predicted HD phosphohydrolase
MDAERREWLEHLSEACERVLARGGGDRTSAVYAALLSDVTHLLARLRAELRDMER